jgi:hypothetical protein
MAGSKDCLKDRLSHYRRIKISVIGRKFGRTISTQPRGCANLGQRVKPFKDVTLGSTVGTLEM